MSLSASHQTELQLDKQPEMRILSEATIAGRIDLLSAIKLCKERGIRIDPVTGSEIALHEKEIYEHLGLDKGHWTRIKDGQAHLAANLYVPLMERCRNYAPLQWLARANGFDLVKRKSRLEQERDDAILRAERAEEKLKYAEDILSRRNT